MIVTALAGAFMALSLSAPPGPVTMETIRRGVRGGFGPALQVQLGSIIGDLTWCLLALVGLAPLVQVGWVRLPLSIAGVAVLVYLGAAGIREALSARHARSPGAAAGERLGGPFRSGLAISMANPMAIGYWLGVGGALVAAGVAGSSTAQTAVFVAGYLGGTLGWCFFMAAAVRWGRLVLTPGLFRLVTLGCGAALLVFGVSLAARMVGPLL